MHQARDNFVPLAAPLSRPGRGSVGPPSGLSVPARSSVGQHGLELRQAGDQARRRRLHAPGSAAAAVNATVAGGGGEGIDAVRPQGALQSRR